MGKVETESTQTNAEKSARDVSQAFLDSLLPHSHRLVPLVAAMLLVTEAILALVVIFSRMSPLQQFVCVVLIVVLPAAVLALAMSTVARLSRRPGFPRAP